MLSPVSIFACKVLSIRRQKLVSHEARDEFLDSYWLARLKERFFHPVRCGGI